MIKISHIMQGKNGNTFLQGQHLIRDYIFYSIEKIIYYKLNSWYNIYGGNIICYTKLVRDNVLQLDNN